MKNAAQVAALMTLLAVEGLHFVLDRSTGRR